MKRVIMKFGGTSVGSAKNISEACGIIKDNIEHNPVVVVSAVGGMTDKLIVAAKSSVKDKALIKKIIDEFKKIHYKILDDLKIDKSIIKEYFDNLERELQEIKDGSDKSINRIVAYGEIISSRMVSAELNQIGVKSNAFNSYDLGFLTTDNYTDAEPVEACYLKMKDDINSMNYVPVITGFIGKNRAGEITTLGRGGSDYTATIIGRAIEAKEIQIWTDVDGVMTTDPRIVKNARTIEEMTFKEASELSFFGAKVLHPKTMIPALEKNIPIFVKNTMNPSGYGTKITENVLKYEDRVVSISLKKKIKIIRIESIRMLDAHGFLAKIFNIFSKYGISVDTLATTEVSVSMTVNNDCDISEIIEELKVIGIVNIYENKSLICIVGRNMDNIHELYGRIFACIEKENIKIRMISQGPSLINISFVIDKDKEELAIKLLHKELIENEA